MKARKPIEFEFHRYSAYYAFDQSHESLFSMNLPDTCDVPGRFVIELAWSSVFSRHAIDFITSNDPSGVYLWMPVRTR